MHKVTQVNNNTFNSFWSRDTGFFLSVFCEFFLSMAVCFSFVYSFNYKKALAQFHSWQQ